MYKTLQEYIDSATKRDKIYEAHQKEIIEEIEKNRAEFDDLLDNGVGRIIPTQKGYHDFN